MNNVEFVPPKFDEPFSNYVGIKIINSEDSKINTKINNVREVTHNFKSKSHFSVIKYTTSNIDFLLSSSFYIENKKDKNTYVIDAGLSMHNNFSWNQMVLDAIKFVRSIDKKERIEYYSIFIYNLSINYYNFRTYYLTLPLA
ncbi:MAG: hypothetical protein JZD41_02430 [Thermoproteus sp.]|nr:hypothetical protein [Thermoproteus sp.]